MGTARPKKIDAVHFSTFFEEAKARISLYPQQKWKYRIDGDKVRLEYKCIDLRIPKADFEEHWKVVE